MIIILGSILARPETLQDLLREGQAHSARSRLEPGCIAHHVHTDAEHPLKIVFVEKWQDMAAVKVHFAVPASGEFVKSLRKLAAAAPVIELFEAQALPMG